MSSIGGLAECSLSGRRVEEISLQVGNGRRGNERWIDICLGQRDTGAQEGVHRALAVRGDQNQAAGGWRFAGQRGGWEMHAHGIDIMAEHTAKLIVRDLADVGNPGAQAGGYSASISC